MWGKVEKWGPAGSALISSQGSHLEESGQLSYYTVTYTLNANTHTHTPSWAPHWKAQFLAIVKTCINAIILRIRKWEIQASPEKLWVDHCLEMYNSRYQTYTCILRHLLLSIKKNREEIEQKKIKKHSLSNGIGKWLYVSDPPHK